MNTDTLFQSRPLIGMIHLPALPGEPGNTHTMKELRRYALEQAAILEAAHFNGVLLENFGDAPFHPDTVPPHITAAMAVIADAIRSQFPHLLLGINILRNATAEALAVAHITGADFIRINVHTGAAITDQGILQGKAHLTIRYRQQLNSTVALWADLNVKHAAPLRDRPLLTVAEEMVERGKADALILTGPATSTAPDATLFRQLKTHLPQIPLIIGSGATPELLQTLAPFFDGCIVGTAIKVGGSTAAPIDPEKARAFAVTYHSLQQNS